MDPKGNDLEFLSFTDHPISICEQQRTSLSTTQKVPNFPVLGRKMLLKPVADI